PVRTEATTTRLEALLHSAPCSDAIAEALEADPSSEANHPRTFAECSPPYPLGARSALDSANRSVALVASARAPAFPVRQPAGPDPCARARQPLAGRPCRPKSRPIAPPNSQCATRFAV